MAVIEKRHDVFISYAHKDNPDPEKPITQLVEMMRKTYSDHYNDEEIDVFFDEEGLKPGDPWENKLLETLRQSAVMIAILSKNYFQSAYCKKEWQHFKDVEIHYSLPGQGIIPERYEDEKIIYKHEKKEENNDWINDLNKYQKSIDISDWQNNRDTDAFREKLILVCEAIHDRRQRLIKRKAIDSNLPRHNKNFTGRAKEIAEIRNILMNGNENNIGVITAIKGIGGIGKSTIAYEYAHAYIDDYQGGTFNFNAEGKSDFREALLIIAEEKKIDLSNEKENDEKENDEKDINCARIWKSISQGPTALLILDNVDNPLILDHIGKYAPDRDKLHILVTSRQGFEIAEHITEIKIQVMENDLSLGLLLKWFPACNDEEHNAAKKIVKRLGGHPLAITMVGAFLKGKKTISYSSQLKWLEQESINMLDYIGKKIKLEDYANPIPSQIFEQVFGNFSKVEMRVLEYAALMPPDAVPIYYITRLIKDEFPDITCNDDLPVSPMDEIIEKLEQFQLLIPYDGGNKRFCTIHRLIQDAVMKRGDYKQHTENAKQIIDHFIPAAVEYDSLYGEGKGMFQLEVFLRRKIRTIQAGPTKFAISFPMYKIEGGLYEIYLVASDGKFYLSDEGTTYDELDKIFEIKEPDVIKNLKAILKQYGCRKHDESNAFIIECTPQDVHIKLSYLIQALSFLLNMKIFYT